MSTKILISYFQHNYICLTQSKKHLSIQMLYVRHLYKVFYLNLLNTQLWLQLCACQRKVSDIFSNSQTKSSLFIYLTWWINSSLWSIIIFWGSPYKKIILIIALEISAVETSHRGKITVHFVNRSVIIRVYRWLLLLAWNGPIRSTVTILHGFSTLRRCCWGARMVFFATWQWWQAYTYKRGI